MSICRILTGIVIAIFFLASISGAYIIEEEIYLEMDIIYKVDWKYSPIVDSSVRYYKEIDILSTRMEINELELDESYDLTDPSIDNIGTYFVLLNDNQEVYRSKFEIFDIHEEIRSDSKRIGLTVPNIGADKIIIYSLNQEIISINLEDVILCTSDDNDGICDPDCLYDLDCSEEQLCNNGKMDNGEISIDCGNICGECEFNDQELVELVLSYDSNQLHKSDFESIVRLGFNYVSTFLVGFDSNCLSLGGVCSASCGESSEISGSLGYCENGGLCCEKVSCESLGGTCGNSACGSEFYSVGDLDCEVQGLTSCCGPEPTCEGFGGVCASECGSSFEMSTFSESCSSGEICCEVLSCESLGGSCGNEECLDGLPVGDLDCQGQGLNYCCLPVEEDPIEACENLGGECLEECWGETNINGGEEMCGEGLSCCELNHDCYVLGGECSSEGCSVGEMGLGNNWCIYENGEGSRCCIPEDDNPATACSEAGGFCLEECYDGGYEEYLQGNEECSGQFGSCCLLINEDFHCTNDAGGVCLTEEQCSEVGQISHQYDYGCNIPEDFCCIPDS